MERSLFQSIKERKLKYCGHVLRKQEESLEKDMEQCLGQGEEVDQGYHGDTTSGIGLECRWCCQVYQTATYGDELFTMQPNFGPKMVKDKTSDTFLMHRGKLGMQSPKLGEGSCTPPTSNVEPSPYLWVIGPSEEQ